PAAALRPTTADPPPKSKSDSLNASAAPIQPTGVAPVTIDPPAAAPAPNTQTEFGLDLGGAATLDGVRQRWVTVKANFGPLLSGMYPIAAHERRAGSTGYRLVVGPLPNSAAASSLCAHFTAARTACRSAKFDGEQIAQR